MRLGKGRRAEDEKKPPAAAIFMLQRASDLESTFAGGNKLLSKEGQRKRIPHRQAMETTQEELFDLQNKGLLFLAAIGPGKSLRWEGRSDISKGGRADCCNPVKNMGVGGFG